METSDYRQRGELLASLSTFGLMEYVHHRFELEYDYLAGVAENINDKLELIRQCQARLQKMAEDRERRARLVSSMEEQVIGSMKMALTVNAAAKSQAPGGGGSTSLTPPTAKIQRLTGTFGNTRRNIISVQGQGVLGGSPKEEDPVSVVNMGRPFSDVSSGLNVKMDGQLYVRGTQVVEGGKSRLKEEDTSNTEMEDSQGSPLRDEDMYHDDH